jgi:hypothetical protein
MKFSIAYLISILAAFAMVMLIYWLGGGEFERGIALGGAVFLAVWFSVVAVLVVIFLKRI